MNREQVLTWSVFASTFIVLFYGVTSGITQQIGGWIWPHWIKHAHQIPDFIILGAVFCGVLYGLWRVMKATIRIHKSGWRRWFRDDFAYAVRNAMLVFAGFPLCLIGLFVFEKIYPLVICAVVLGLILWAKHQWCTNAKTEQRTSHGTSRFATVDDLSAAGMFGTYGMCVGTFKGHEVRLPRAIHTAVIAPTGAGKGVSFVIPMLMECPDSCVVVDFKGDLAKITAGFRRKHFGHHCILLDPYHAVTETPDTFNPLDFISDSPTAFDEVRDLAETQVIRTGKEVDGHWCDGAEFILGAQLAAVVRHGDPDDRSLQTVRKILSSPKNFELANQVLERFEDWDGLLARLGGQLRHYKDRELASMMTTANRFVGYLDSPAIMESTRHSTFDPMELKHGNATIYLILPPEHSRVASPLLRLWIGSMLSACVRGGMSEHNIVRFICDEASALGHMQQIDDAVDRLRSYGVRMHFIWQSLGQIKKNFPDGQDQTLLSNVTQIYFGVNDFQTAEYVSKQLGNETIIVESGGTTSGDGAGSSNTHGREQSSSSSRNRSSGSSNNWAEKERGLLQPAEVLNLNPRWAITFTPNCRPILSLLNRYYEKTWGKPAKSSLPLKQSRASVWGATFVMFLAGILFWQIVLHLAN